MSDSTVQPDSQTDSAADGRSIFPMGLTVTDRGIHLSLVSAGDHPALLLYRRNEAAPLIKIPFSGAERQGLVWSMFLSFSELFAIGLTEETLQSAEYHFADERGSFPDPFGLAFSGRDSWGREEQYGAVLRSPIFLKPFDWGEDRRPGLPFSDSVIYRLHVRGFTKSAASGVVQRGSFYGVIEKIPYLKALGVTTVELLPCQEFEELMPREAGQQDFPSASDAASAGRTGGRLNYWGYTKAYHFAPKASYCRRKDRDPAGEFRLLVRELHRAGMELIPEFYFDGSEDIAYVLAVLRYYARFFHVDGVRLSGHVDTEAVARDPYLADIKLIADGWSPPKPGERYPFFGMRNGDLQPEAAGQHAGAMARRDCGGGRRLGSCNDGFLRDIRRYLKGDEGLLQALIYHTKNNPRHAAVINYLAGTNGFTLMDAVSYDVKHNEKNGEDNRDGTDENFSWNCGAEGPTRRKKVLELRHRQLKNAFLLLFLSQGTPLILAGDEFGNSQSGNNNAYCQDNALSWLDWKQQKKEAALLRFVRDCIAFRRRHPAFHMEEEPRLLDPDGCGIPDVSYHGTRAWQPEFEPWRRQLGVLYSGHYAQTTEGTADASFYLLCNMHWEPHEFALPHPERGMAWHLLVSTAEEGFGREEEARCLADQQLYVMPERSIALMIARPDPNHSESRSRKKCYTGAMNRKKES